MNDIKQYKTLEEKVNFIREVDIVKVLENALNYGSPWDSLYTASLEEITELRRQVIELGGYLPMAQSLLKAEKIPQKLYFTDPRNE